MRSLGGPHAVFSDAKAFPPGYGSKPSPKMRITLEAADVDKGLKKDFLAYIVNVVVAENTPGYGLNTRNVTPV
jgi:hypothetical protein